MSNGFESNGAVPQFYCKKILQQCVHVKYIYICLKFKKKELKKKLKHVYIMLHCCIYRSLLIIQFPYFSHKVRTLTKFIMFSAFHSSIIVASIY